tara:strand:- start:121 stop:366 length:246 start_codon:yes stop_codon:yes gene_type:complete
MEKTKQIEILTEHDIYLIMQGINEYRKMIKDQTPDVFCYDELDKEAEEVKMKMIKIQIALTKLNTNYKGFTLGNKPLKISI